MRTPPPPSIDLSIVITNSNGRELMRACLASLPAACEGLAWEVIVVDNGSTDGTQAMIREKFPDTVLIENADNRGFTRANNQGFEVARGRWICMLNNDTESHARCFTDALAVLDPMADVGAAGLRLLNADGSRQLSCRRFPTFQQALFNRYSVLTRMFPNNPFSQSYLMSDLEEHPDKILDVDWVSGACLVFRREVADRIGWLDERFWMYSEDVDFCLRIWQDGWRVVFLPACAVIHYIGQNTGIYPYMTTVERHRSMYRFYKKHYSRELLFVDLATAIMVASRCAMQVASIFVRRLMGAKPGEKPMPPSAGGGEAAAT